MKKINILADAFMVIGVVSVVYLAYVGIHEMGHYVVNEQNDINNRQVCFLGWMEDRNGTAMSILAWVGSDWTNNTEVLEWHDNWDYVWYGWLLDAFNIGEEIG